MILEALVFVVAVVLMTREVRAMRKPVVAQAVTKNQKSGQLKRLEEYAARLYSQKQYLSAEKAYIKILKLNHRDAFAYNRLGLIYISLNNREDAIECFQISAQLNPSAATWYNLGQAYNDNGNAIKAVAAIEKAIMFEPSAQRYQGLAKSYIKMGNNAKAITALQQSLKHERTKKTLTLLAETYAKNHEREKMAETYRQILELDPGDHKAKRLAAAS